MQLIAPSREFKKFPKAQTAPPFRLFFYGLKLSLALGMLLTATAILSAQESETQNELAAETKPAQPNVLFIISDDLTAESLSCYGNAQCQTLAIDRLASQGVRFDAAYCQFPVCGPSRAALMSGLYPQSIGVVGNGSAGRFTARIGELPSMSQWFRQQGYYAARVSKIYHMRVPGDITKGVSGPDHAASWDKAINMHCPEWMSSGEKIHLSNEKLRFDPDEHYNLGFGAAFYVVKGDTDGSEQPDQQAADRAIEILKEEREGPFFLAVGMVRPHVPLVAPASYYEPYPPEEMALPVQHPDDWADLPKQAISKNSEKSGLTTTSKKQEVLSAYYASVAYMDTQVGRILKALEEQGLADNTIVVFTSDHGYHLGEHEFWQKLSLHEESARIPLIIAGPGIQPSVSDSLAQQIDLYPTLAELAGLPVPKHLQGRSLAPIVAAPDANVHEFVYCMKGNGELLRSKQWAYIRYQDGSEELYDMIADPQQFENLASLPEPPAELDEMRSALESKKREIAESSPIQ